MSETLFAAPAPEQEAPPVAPVEDSTAAKDQRRKVLALVGAAAVAVVAIAGYFVMKGGSGDQTTAALPPVHHHPAAGAPAQPKFDSKSFPTLPDVFKDVVGRDPFKPLVVDKPAAPAAQAPAPTTVVAGGAPTTVTTGSTATAPTAQPDWISLESQNGLKSATFLVHSTDGKATGYTDVAAPADGKTTAFGGYFALISLQDGFAVVQMGDGKPFNLQVGYTNRHMLS
jgi:hypothetical protein